MKKIALLVLSVAGLMLASCGEENNGTDSQKTQQTLPKLNVWTVPAKGQKVADYSKAIKDDLNKSKFEVIISTTDSSAANGTFKIDLNYGANQNSTDKLFPKWYENNVVKPMVKGIDSLEYGAVIGFDPGDGSFQELYQVTVKDKEIKFQQTKMYGTQVN
ncbi:hypothetical protein [Edaphocola flava]|uniref:hypothetical protein n=1 Tax=Edaphocola flava TaxID=2499629 RepID=UPI00100A94F1|nr:hypothetical protein [Edaphocola flava]